MSLGHVIAKLEDDAPIKDRIDNLFNKTNNFLTRFSIYIFMKIKKIKNRTLNGNDRQPQTRKTQK